MQHLCVLLPLVLCTLWDLSRELKQLELSHICQNMCLEPAGFNTCPLNRIVVVQDVLQLVTLPEGAPSAAAAALATVAVRSQPATFVKSNVMAQLSQLGVCGQTLQPFCVLKLWTVSQTVLASYFTSLMQSKLFSGRFGKFG